MQFNYSNQNNAHLIDSGCLVVNQLISCYSEDEVADILFSIQVVKKKTMQGAVQCVGGILQKASSLKLEISTVELFNALLQKMYRCQFEYNCTCSYNTSMCTLT